MKCSKCKGRGFILVQDDEAGYPYFDKRMCVKCLGKGVVKNEG